MMLKGTLGYPSHIPYKGVSITRLAPLLFAHPDLSLHFCSSDLWETGVGG